MPPDEPIVRATAERGGGRGDSDEHGGEPQLDAFRSLIYGIAAALIGSGHSSTDPPFL